MTLNAIMVFLNIFTVEISLDVIKISTFTMPFVILAIITSNIVHNKLIQIHFQNLYIWYYLFQEY